MLKKILFVASMFAILFSSSVRGDDYEDAIARRDAAKVEAVAALAAKINADREFQRCGGRIGSRRSGSVPVESGLLKWWEVRNRNGKGKIRCSSSRFGSIGGCCHQRTLKGGPDESRRT